MILLLVTTIDTYQYSPTRLPALSRLGVSAYGAFRQIPWRVGSVDMCFSLLSCI